MTTLLVALVLVAAYANASGVPLPVLASGAVLLGPPLVLAGYGLLRDQELEPHRGMSLLACVLVLRTDLRPAVGRLRIFENDPVRQARSSCSIWLHRSRWLSRGRGRGLRLL